jgi:hypothetical protein
MTVGILVDESAAADVMKVPAAVILSLFYPEEEGRKSFETLVSV